MSEFKTTQFITRDTLRVLHNNLRFIPAINRAFDSEFGQKGKKIGNKLEIRLPNQFTVRSGNLAVPQSINEETVALTQSNIHGIDTEFSDADFALSVDDLRERYSMPMGKRLASELESLVLAQLVPDVYQAVGTPGTTPASVTPFFDAQRKLDEALAPEDDRTALINPAANATALAALTTLTNPAADISKQYRKGYMANIAGFDVLKTPMIPIITCGTRTNTTPLTNSATAQVGSSLIVDGLNAATATIEKGAVFTIDGVYDVHPETKKSYSNLKQFTVTAAATGSGSAVTLSISPAIIAEGAKQNVSNGAANDKAITFAGTASTVYPMNIAFHKDAFAFVSAELPMHKDSVSCVTETYDNISIRTWIGSDIMNNRQIIRTDVLWGAATLMPSQATRIWG